MYSYSDQKQNLQSLFVPFVVTLVGTCPLAEVMNDVNNMEINFLRMHISLSSEMIVIILKQMFVRIASVLSVLCRIFFVHVHLFSCSYENLKSFLWPSPQKNRLTALVLNQNLSVIGEGQKKGLSIILFHCIILTL